MIVVKRPKKPKVRGRTFDRNYLSRAKKQMTTLREELLDSCGRLFRLAHDISTALNEHSIYMEDADKRMIARRTTTVVRTLSGVRDQLTIDVQNRIKGFRVHSIGQSDPVSIGSSIVMDMNGIGEQLMTSVWQELLDVVDHGSSVCTTFKQYMEADAMLELIETIETELKDHQ